MCTNYTPTRNKHWVTQNLGVDLPEQRNVKCTLARFGLVPHWAKDANIGRRTYIARTETVAEKLNYRAPWRRRKFAIALSDDFF